MSDGAYGKLLIINPDKTRTEVPINAAEFRLGQDPGNNAVLQGPRVAPAHAVLRWNGSALVLFDLQSADGTAVNQAAIREHFLQQGDVIAIGEYRIVYHKPVSVQKMAPIPGGDPTFRVDEPVPSGRLHSPTGALAGIHAPDGMALVVYTPSGTFSYPLAPGHAVRIGADPGCDVHVSYAGGVKPQHARIEWEGQNAVAVDADGKTDVLVNGQPTARKVLVNGDFIKLGEARFVYHDTRALAGSAASPLMHTVTGSLNRATLGKTVRIGRDPQNDIPLNNLQVSRFHSEIQREGRDFVLVDLGSTNGTFLNGQKISGKSNLKKGDHIRISDFHFMFDGEKLEHYSEEGNARIDCIGLKRIVANGRAILQDISLSIYPREFVALVGVSGAGKSTLMNALSGFRPADKGVVLLNGTDYYHHFDAFRATLGYVPQDDIIHKELTVYRALHYAACLRLPEDVSAEEIHTRIEEVMRDLHLSERRDSPISRLSGGQRKRVSIGVELLTKPRLFYLDEPTSGLDPGMETEMMRIFRNLADKGHTMILVTHATKNINLCDKVIFLAEGGYLAFYGSPAEALQYFGTSDFTDIYIKLENEKKPEIWGEEYKQSVYYQRNVVDRLKEVHALVEKAKTQEQSDGRGAVRTSGHKMSAMHQFKILTQRYCEILVRDTGNLAILLGSALVVAMLFFVFKADMLKPFDLSLYHIENPAYGAIDPWPPGLTPPPRTLSDGSLELKEVSKNATNARLVTFLAAIAAIFFGVNNAIREIAKEMPVYKRERTVNLKIHAYVFSKVVVLAVICAIQVFVLEGVIVAHFWLPAGINLARIFLSLWSTSLAA
ncbi:MAG: FHA domain-containing protein, partial [Candidatus Xenobia bacterium]